MLNVGQVHKIGRKSQTTSHPLKGQTLPYFSMGHRSKFTNSPLLAKVLGSEKDPGSTEGLLQQVSGVCFCFPHLSFNNLNITDRYVSFT